MLTQEQLHEFRDRLKERFYQLREEIRQELIESDEEHYIELAGRVHDLEEASVADLLVDLNLAEIDRKVNEIREIDAALIRIANGTYGICIDTGEPIELERLRANPTAKRTFRAQQMHEKTYSGGSHHSL